MPKAQPKFEQPDIEADKDVEELSDADLEEMKVEEGPEESGELVQMKKEQALEDAEDIEEAETSLELAELSDQISEMSEEIDVLTDACQAFKEKADQRPGIGKILGHVFLPGKQRGRGRLSAKEEHDYANVFFQREHLIYEYHRLKEERRRLRAGEISPKSKKSGAQELIPAPDSPEKEAMINRLNEVNRQLDELEEEGKILGEGHRLLMVEREGIAGHLGRQIASVFTRKDAKLKQQAEDIDLLFIDFRYFGDSGGSYTTAGVLEVNDLLAAVKYLQIRGKSSIGVYGFSMGGAVALLSLEKADEIDAVITESAYADLRLVAQDIYKYFGPLKYPFAWMTDVVAKLFLGVGMEQADVVRAISGTQVPILLIHSKSDSVIPFQSAEMLRSALQDNPKAEFLFSDDLIHGQPPPGFGTLVKDFFSKHLQEP